MIAPAVAPARRWPAWLPTVLLLGAGALVFLPAIASPMFLDDYFQTSMIEGTYPVSRSPLNLYDFVGDADRAVLLDRGLLPWWSHPRITVRFLRPLSSALLYADHRVFGAHPLLFHLHSLVWWSAAVLAARALFRRTLPARPALFASFIFALAPCHAFPLVWLANREVLVSITFGIFALGALARFRRDGGAGQAAIAFVLFSLSLLGGEYALGFGGYALALAATGRRSGQRRVVTVATFAAPALVYLVVRAKLGYGAEGSGFYHDPFRDPVAFLARAPRRIVTLLSEAWLTYEPGDLDSPAPWWVLAILAIAGVALLWVPVRRAFAALDEEQSTDARWLFAGSLLSIVPMLSVMPAPRVLGASMVGVAAIVALVLDRAWFPPGVEPREGASELSGLVALGLGFAHLVHGPGTSWLTSRNCRIDALAFVDHAAELKEKIAGRADEVMLVRGLSGSVFVLPYALDDRGTPPARWRILALAPHVLVFRKDARTLDVVAPLHRAVFPTGEGNLFRGEGAPLAVGDVVRVPGMTATVVEVGEAGPRRMRFELDDALESPTRVWVADRADALVDATPPAPGYGAPLDQWPPVEEAKTE